MVQGQGPAQDLRGGTQRSPARGGGGGPSAQEGRAADDRRAGIHAPLPAARDGRRKDHGTGPGRLLGPLSAASSLTKLKRRRMPRLGASGGVVVFFGSTIQRAIAPAPSARRRAGSGGRSRRAN